MALSRSRLTRPGSPPSTMAGNPGRGDLPDPAGELALVRVEVESHSAALPLVAAASR